MTAHHDVGLQLPRLGSHRAVPVVEEVHQRHACHAVTLAVGGVVGVGHNQCVIVGESGGAVIVLSDDYSPMPAPFGPAYHNRMVLQQRFFEEGGGTAIVVKLRAYVAYGLYADESCVA